METAGPLRILLVEDLPSDAELAEHELRKEGILFTSLRVERKEEFLQALEEFQPDLIISDYAMPKFDGMQALQLSLAHDPHLPFILLTGSMNEETAVACMKAGATDYIIKERITRLPLAVRGAFEQRNTRLGKEEKEEELIAIYENAPLIMMLVDAERRVHKVNGCTAAFSGRSADAMHLMRCGEALRCLNGLASPEGCGFAEPCKRCIIRLNVTDTFETGRSHRNVEGSLLYRSDHREGKMAFLLSTARLNFRRQPLVLVTLLDITELKQADEELRASEERFKTIFNQGPLGIALIDSMTGHLDTANPMFARIAGRTREGMAHIDWMSITHPDDVREILDNIGLLNAGEIGEFRTQIRYLRPDGSIVWINMTLVPLAIEDTLHPHHLCMIEDITERRQAEESLRLSEENFHRSLDDSPLGVRIVSEEGETLYANRALLEIIGCESIEELRKTPVTKRYTEASFVEYQARKEKRRLHMDEPSDYEIDIARKDGTVRHLQVWRKRILWDGKEHYQVIYRDITNRKQAETALQRQNAYLKALNETALGLMSRMDLGDLLQTIVVKATCLVGAVEGWICLYEPQSNEFEYKAAIGQTEYQIGSRFESGRGIAGEVWRTGKTVLVEDYHLWPKRAMIGGYDIRRATVAVPLRHEGRLAGIIGLAHHDAARRFEDNDLAILERLGELASIALDNAGLYDRMKRELAQRKKAEEELLSTAERLRRSLAGTVQAISMAVAVKDPYTSGHQKRTADLARAIATEMGFSADRTDFVRIASTIHDIGKIAIPSEILSKPTKLTEIEFSLVKTHSQAGHAILKDVDFPWPLAEVILQHHERMDGSGYPAGLKGDAILLEARILAVADAVEAIASYRPYRPAMGIEAALEEIERNKGVLYDKDVAEVCLRLFREKGFQLG